MFWKKFWAFVKTLWAKITRCSISGKNHTALDTASVKLFGLDIKITREIPLNIPYELTVVVPRAEYHWSQASQSLEIILSSITIVHSPRHSAGTGREQTTLSKQAAA